MITRTTSRRHIFAFADTRARDTSGCPHQMLKLVVLVLRGLKLPTLPQIWPWHIAKSIFFRIDTNDFHDMAYQKGSFDEGTSSHRSRDRIQLKTTHILN